MSKGNEFIHPFVAILFCLLCYFAIAVLQNAKLSLFDKITFSALYFGMVLLLLAFEYFRLKGEEEIWKRKIKG